MDSNSSSATKYATFVDLPYELRERIYELALPVGWNIVANLDHAPLKEPSLFSTNRQVRAEAMEIFYERNTFEIRNNREQTWAQQFAIVPDHVLSYLRNVRLWEDSDRNAYTFPHVKQEIIELEDEYLKKGLRAGVVRICIHVGSLWMSSRDLNEHEPAEDYPGRVIPKAWDGPKRDLESINPNEMKGIW